MKWIQAFRLRTLPLALSSVLMGAAVIAEPRPRFSLLLVLTILTTVLLQVLSNLANDYGDSRNGADNAGRIGPMRAVQSGAISVQAMKRAVVLTALLALAAGLALLWVAFPREEDRLMALVFLVLGLVAIAAAINYTAGARPYGYRGLGDLSVLLFFGVLGVSGSAFLFEGSFRASTLLPAVAIGSFATAVLNLNNMRDLVNDRESGKITLAVRLGFAKAKRYHLFLFAAGWISLLSWTLFFAPHLYFLGALVIALVHLRHLRFVMSCQDHRLLDPELKKIALSTFLLSVLFLVFRFAM